ncbi:MAG TPA: exodeoxyribonuclease V subunit alpha [Rhodocyclaceae bacterium]|nr:exodeoxyribonuclease V subunit alpha [Rhodocyclaceae bacterium]
MGLFDSAPAKSSTAPHVPKPGLAKLAALPAGALDDIDFHFAKAVAAWGGDDEPVVLAAALLSHLSSAGHVCADLSLLADEPLPFDTYRRAPDLSLWRVALLAHGACGGPEAGKPLVLEGDRLYLARHWRNEEAVAANLKARAALPVTVDEARLQQGLTRLFGDDAATVGQRDAAARAVKSRVALVSGGPGTGKTTTLTALLALVVEQSSSLRILLAAPTGKAAARMQEAVAAAKGRLPLDEAVAAAIPDQAQTLHRLLGLRPDGHARYHRDHPLPADLLVVDEASMVDLSLMAKVLDALPPTARLVLLGDRDQLASVEAGAVFADLCASAEAGGVLAAGFGALTHSFRFAGSGGIGRLAAAVRAGDGQGALALLQDADDNELRWQIGAEPQALISAALDGYGDYLDAMKAGANAAELHRRFSGFRLLAAHREGPWGIRRLNGGIERALGALGPTPRQPWYPGKPVMVSANDYGLRLFNGDIGIAAIDPVDGLLKVWFEDQDANAPGLRGFLPTRLPAHDTAWAMTVHKSQGSEFDRVMLALPEASSLLLTRELLYTAVTRARHQAALWADAGSVLAACARKNLRYSGLAGRLGGR